MADVIHTFAGPIPATLAWVVSGKPFELEYDESGGDWIGFETSK